MPQSSKIGIFLDADGVLWTDNGAGEILNGLAEATSRLKDFINALGRRDLYVITVVTNQTFAARGEIGYLNFRNQVNIILNSLINVNLIDHFEVCYHHPQAKNILLRRKHCVCRKPAPGMILKTIAKFNLQPGRCVLIGDRITDISAGVDAGLGDTVLIYNAKALEINESIGTSSQIGKFLKFQLRNDLIEAATIVRMQNR